MKHQINRILNKLGIMLTKFKKSPYEDLLSIPRYNEVKINLLGKEFTIPDSLSFYNNYREIFLDEIYKFKCNKKSPIIIDCGSNYGTSIIYFKTMFPDSIILGVEGDPEIFNILKTNIDIRNYKNITLFNKALANELGTIKFFNEGADGGRIHEMDNSKKSFDVETIALDNLINGEVDFLKIDIEGAETDVLSSSKKLNQVKKIFIEYHSFADSNQQLSQLLGILSNNQFRYYIRDIYCPAIPFQKIEDNNGMDLQLSIFAIKNAP
ncbi:FkbM family methyltransferase [Candidatus Marinimicrobia bacterium]|nr:FkbM family methyltransferase [Candidatus Neomarinimicrobiota bacterium]